MMKRIKLAKNITNVMGKALQEGENLTEIGHIIAIYIQNNYRRRKYKKG